MHLLEAQLEQGFGWINQRKFELAFPLFKSLTQTHATSPYTWSGLAICLESHSHTEALSAHKKALNLAPNEPEFLNNLGILEQKMGKFTEAIERFSTLLKSAPHPVVFYNLALCYEAHRKSEESLKVLVQANNAFPDTRYILEKMADLYKELNEKERAKATYHQLVQKNINNASYYYELALLSNSSVDRIRYGMKSVQVNPQFFNGHTLLATVYSEQDYDFAVNYIYKIYKKSRDPSYLLHYLSLLPRPIPDSNEAIKKDREEIRRLLKTAQEIAPENINTSSLIQSPFYLAYHGLNDKFLKKDLEAYYRRFLRIPSLKQPLTGRKKIGFVSCFFYQHSVSRCYSTLIKAFKEAGFDVSIFYICLPGKSQSDPMLKQLKDMSNHFHTLHTSTSKNIAKTIKESDLEYLVYTDIGMESITYLLSLHRLAPIQMVLPGHPITTGVSTIDYFISPEVMETPEAQDHYSETLITLPGVPTDYEKPLMPSHMKERKHWGFKSSDHLYLCPMTLFKIHPDFDGLIFEILKRDPQGILVFFEGQKGLKKPLIKRLSKQNPALMSRIQFLPWQPLEDLMALIYHSEVILDPLHFGGGNTCYLCFSIGTPMVTRPSPFMRSRGTLALYNIMDISTPPIAKTNEEYIDFALRIAKDSEYRDHLRTEILSKNHSLFGDPTHNMALIDFCLSLQKK